jgi:PAS domain S-box-containing protein
VSPVDHNKLKLPEHLTKLLSLNLLNMPDDPAFDRLTRLAIKALNVPISLIALADSDRCYFVSLIGADDLPEQLPALEAIFWQEAAASSQELRIEDARQHPLVQQYNLIACAAVPLITSDGYTLGSFCAIDSHPRQWTDDELEILRELAHSAVTEIELRGELVRLYQLEEVARDNEARLAAVITTAPLILFTTDREGTITLSVGKGLDGLGRHQNESFGKNVFELYRDHQELIYWLRRVLAGEAMAGMLEIRNLTFDCWFSPLYDRTGSVSGVIGVLIDITERVKAELALQGLLERLVALHDIESELSPSLNLTNVLQISAAILQRVTKARDGFIGLFSGDQIEVVHTIGRYQKGRLFDKSTGVIGRALSSREAIFIPDVESEPEYVRSIPDTRAKMCLPLTYHERMIGIVNLETTQPDHFTEDAFEFVKLLVGQITLAIDNAQLYETAQKQLAEMAQLYTRVSELEKLKTDIIRIAAHDLRNPLTQVIGYSDLLLESPFNLDADQLEFLESIQRAGKKMERLINDILSLQRVEAGNNANLDVIDLVQLVRSTFAENENKARDKGQEYSLSVPEGAVRVKGDSAQIREALDNLINNAIKYTPVNGTIAVRLRVEDAAQKKVIFEVEDSGIGVPAEQQASLFQPFFRARMSETTQIDGTGLGLHLVKNIVERHQGQMRFHSEYGHGSTFGFELPGL